MSASTELSAHPPPPSHAISLSRERTGKKGGGERAPAAWAAAAFAGGVGFSGWLPAEWTPLFLPAALGAAWLLLSRRRPAAANAALLLAVCLLGAFRAQTDRLEPAGSIRQGGGETPRPVTVEAVLLSDPERSPVFRHTESVWAAVRRIRTEEGWEGACGKLRLRLPRWDDSLRVGDRLVLSGLLRGGREEGWDEAGWLWRQGAAGVLIVSSREGVIRLGSSSDPWSRYRRWTARLRERFRRTARALLKPEAAGLLEGLVLGERGGIPSEVWEGFRRSGTVHVLVVSGLHVGLTAALFGGLLALLRVPPAVRWPLLAALLVTYAVLTGLRVPVVRATVMGILLILSRWRGGEISAFHSLGWAALWILGGSPRALADPGFQLSFAAVLGILAALRWVCPRAAAAFRQTHLPGRWARRAVQALAVSCGAWAATAPLLAWRFGAFTPWAPLANLIAVPWAALLVALGFWVVGVGSLLPWAARPAAALFEALSAWLTAAAAGRGP